MVWACKTFILLNFQISKLHSQFLSDPEGSTPTLGKNVSRPLWDEATDIGGLCSGMQGFGPYPEGAGLPSFPPGSCSLSSQQSLRKAPQIPPLCFLFFSRNRPNTLHLRGTESWADRVLGLWLSLSLPSLPWLSCHFFSYKTWMPASRSPTVYWICSKHGTSAWLPSCP